MKLHVFVLAGGLALYGGAAVAQSAPAAGQDAPKTDVTGQGTLSDKLGQTGGVIHPTTDVDPGIAKPAPAPGTGTMPVIPPPGTPGGDPSVQPK